MGTKSIRSQGVVKFTTLRVLQLLAVAISIVPCFPQSENDHCDDATIAVINEGLQTNVQGSTLGATSENVQITESCEDHVGHKGVWYTFQGKDIGIQIDCSLFPQTASFYMDVFSGDCEAGLVCITSQSCPGLDGGKFGFVTSSDQTYYIWIHNRRQGTSFTMTLDTFPLPPNNDCRNSIGPLAPGTLVTGTTELATADVVPFCVDTDTSFAPEGIWYAVDGADGMALEATANTTISVYEGSCIDLGCVGGNSFGQVSWRTESKKYFILVHDFPFKGDFLLNVAEFEPVDNDVCDDAVGPLPATGSITTGTVLKATLDDIPYCSKTSVLVHGKGVWYTVVGTGESIMASTCTENTSFDAQILVFSGECENLACVDENSLNFYPWSTCESANMKGESFTWEAAEGVTYYVLVQGIRASDAEELDFGLFIKSNSTNDEPSGSNCCGPSSHGSLNKLVSAPIFVAALIGVLFAATI